MKKIVITRKIQLNVDLESGTEEKKKAFQNLYAWQRYTHRAANLISTHNFIQDKVKDMIYLTDEAKVKLANIEKDEEGILNTSKLNSTYKIISDEFIGKVPSSILTSLNSVITQTYNTEKKEYYTGVRALRNYKNNIPIPFQKTSIRNLRWDQGRNNLCFTLFSIPFVTYLGVDKSGNRSIIKKILEGTYDMGDSSLQLKDKKIFLLLTVKFDKEDIKLDPEKEILAHLDIETPIIAKYKRTEHRIGTYDSFVHRRLQIQKGLKRRQESAKFNAGGKGRKKKLKSIEHYHDLEKNYINTRFHQYARELIKFALNKKAGVIRLLNVSESDEQSKENPFLLRNWGYHGLIDKIQYKADIYGIEVVKE